MGEQPNADAANGVTRMTKNQRRRLKKKALKQQKQNLESLNPASTPEKPSRTEKTSSSAPPLNTSIEYVSEDLSNTLKDNADYEEFSRIFEKFSSAEALCGQDEKLEDKTNDTTEGTTTTKDNHNNSTDVEEQPTKVLSRKMKKKLKRLSVAELKQLVDRSDVVEAHDVTADDPRFLIYLKSYRNTVPVPPHWCHKRRYLQGKRGIEKIPFTLPDYIANTGIAGVRGAAVEEHERKTASQKSRDALHVKAVGRVDIDYQVLHDAFFRYQTKPIMTSHGDLYYEGREFEVNLKKKTPGVLSDELKSALGMSDPSIPPPWLLHMQRYGPPPAYPRLKIPGLNAPIPSGASFGYHPGGWGKPPVDEVTGRPLYGDVFAKVEDDDATANNGAGGIPEEFRQPWGVITEEEVVEEESSEEEEEEEEMEEEERPAARQGTTKASPVVLPMPSDNDGGAVELRKMEKGTESVPPSNAQLYTVLKQSQASVSGGNIYGSSHAYDIADDGTKSNVASGTISGVASTTTESRKRGGGGDSQYEEKRKSKKYKDFKF